MTVRTRAAASAVVLTIVFSAACLAQEPAFMTNGSFESLHPVELGADGKISAWTLADPPQVPDNWNLNSAYPGHLEISEDRPQDGDRFVRITSGPGTTAHLFQMCTGLEANKWYRVSLWARGGPISAHFYEYCQSGIHGQTVIGGVAGPEWRQFWAYYSPGRDDYNHSAIAVYTAPGQTVDVDGVSIEALDLPELPEDTPTLTFETDFLRLGITTTGRLAELVDKESGTDHASFEVPFPVISATRRGMFLPAHSITQEGDILQVQFLDPDVSASIRVTPRASHIRFEVVSAEPDDLDELRIEFPVKRLATVGGAFNATYDDEFGVALFGATVNARNLFASQGNTCRLRCGSYREHEITNAAFTLVGAPRDRFNAAIMDTEQQNGLPCPIIDGKWVRESDAVRKSYLFATGVVEPDIDTLIEYAKIGGFGTIIFLKDSWLANHGHFDVNLNSFPDGIQSVRRAVDKIHAAGLDAGVHVFGPSISANDPYIAPVPDDRLASVECPPLAEALDAAGTTVTFAEQPNLPPKTGRSQAFPGHYLRVGDEIIRYTDAIEDGQPFRFLNCQRGALGTKASAHPAGAEVKGLLALWGFFIVDPDSTLADELTRNFADVINDCDFDFVYFDASDGLFDPYIDRWYYLNKLHLGFYEKFDKGILYQTSNGTGSDIPWHIVPRSASADGHGDIKGYLDDRWPGILGMGSNFTKADIGWYYWFKECRPDQIEYVCARALGVDGSISLETSREAMDRLSQSRQMFEMIGKWERCRAARYFDETVMERLKEPQKDFKLFDDGQGGWSLYRAVYEEPRMVDTVDGQQNLWTITNDRDEPCSLGIEVVRGQREIGAPSDYTQPGVVSIAPFTSAEPYLMSETNQFEKFVIGDQKKLTETGPVRDKVTQSFEVSTESRTGESALVYAAENKGGPGGWCGIGRRFDTPLDLSAFRGIGLWLLGDGNQEILRIQMRDTEGRHADVAPIVSFKGWRLLTFPLPAGGIDLSKVEYLLFYFNGISPNSSVKVMIDGLKALPKLNVLSDIHDPIVRLNGREIRFPITLSGGEALTSEGPDGIKHWPGGMNPARPVDLSNAILQLQPGENQVEFTCDQPERFPGDVQVLLYRMWPMEP